MFFLRSMYMSLKNVLFFVLTQSEGGSVKRSLPVSLMIAVSLILSQPVWAFENNLSVGYGFALWSEKHSVGRIAEGPYNFVQASYSYEMPISQKWLVQAGPFLAYVMNPNDGVDVGLNLGIKAYPFSRDHSGFFFTLGTGGAYSKSLLPNRQSMSFLFSRAVSAIVIRAFSSKTDTDTIRMAELPRLTDRLTQTSLALGSISEWAVSPARCLVFRV
jgi:hypothetical protein